MTNEEAIKYFKMRLAERTHPPTTAQQKAFTVALEALEKQIPKKVTCMNEQNGESFYCLDFVCPACDEAVIRQPYRPHNCKHCGQALDWKVE